MAIFSCGSMAPNQILSAFTHSVYEMRLTAQQTADCLASESAPDEALRIRTDLPDILSSLFAQVATGDGNAKDQLASLIQQSKCFDRFPCYRDAEGLVQATTAFRDIVTGFRSIKRLPDNLRALGANDTMAISDWVHAKNDFLIGRSPIDCMTGFRGGVSAVASWVSADFSAVRRILEFPEQRVT